MKSIKANLVDLLCLNPYCLPHSTLLLNKILKLIGKQPVLLMFRQLAAWSGRRFAGSLLSAFLNTSFTLASLHFFGKIPKFSERLINQGINLKIFYFYIICNKSDVKSKVYNHFMLQTKEMRIRRS